jgi:hypothetical protein
MQSGLIRTLSAVAQCVAQGKNMEAVTFGFGRPQMVSQMAQSAPSE